MISRAKTLVVMAVLAGMLLSVGVLHAGGLLGEGWSPSRSGSSWVSSAPVPVPEPALHAGVLAVSVLGLTWLRRRRR